MYFIILYLYYMNATLVKYIQKFHSIPQHIMNTNRKCTSCQKQTRNIIFLPCGHIVKCALCHNTNNKNIKQICSYCFQHIKRSYKITLP